MRKTLIGALALALLIVGISAALPAQTRTQPASASDTKPFDHSQCQYPSRTTNPPDGCDNSDPANPYCAVKGLPEACQDPAQTPAPVVEQPKPAQPPPAAQCGGK